MGFFVVINWMLLLPLTVAFWWAPSRTELIALSDGTMLEVEVASTRRARERGLSGREDIGDGMLFCFRDEAIRNFWMNDMLVPLDVVWLRDAVIVGVDENVPVWNRVFVDPVDDPFSFELEWTQFPSPEPVNAVLELPVGSVAAHSLKEGDVIVGTGCVPRSTLIRRLP
ncbi:hypothetical protein A3I45_02435 [Candidatus Uhrbacteria bacterium RIFCSPLOWO2_02_FULL_53_10]|uniref:DUF192 domain-containing protein n=1 Tax=Candidatus Uhrbacteria bacterium RIFCSPLOWO2_02_FULL_53_10 TaxID=1802411 RepID=A0A1F7VI45_9BACT|nr:MAG: hypothetical protein A3I45_02435 [Candidatus Uhrbacteria bacterium RIFCSPLOWO2_02_FULL_53_10]